MQRSIPQRKEEIISLNQNRKARVGKDSKATFIRDRGNDIHANCVYYVKRKGTDSQLFEKMGTKY